MNRHPREALTLEVGVDAGVGAAAGWHASAATVLHDADVHAANTQDDPWRVRPRDLRTTTAEGGAIVAVLPPVSWALIRLRERRPAVADTFASIGLTP